MGRGGASRVITVLLSPAEYAAGDRVAVDPDEAHHLEVRRARDREVVAFVDGAGRRGQGRLILGHGAPAVAIDSVVIEPAPAGLVLGVGAGDRDRFSWLAEKAAEIGVTELAPLDTDRTTGVATRVRAQHVGKLQRRAREALKQSGNAWAPSLRDPEPLARFLSRATGGRWLLDAGGEPAPLAIEPGPVFLLVGPEGGLTAAERAAAIAAGFRPTTVGPHVLRFETAALAGAILLQRARAPQGFAQSGV